MIQPGRVCNAPSQLFLHGCSSVDRARLCEGRGHKFESCQPYQTLFGARPMAGCETLNLEIVVRVHGAEPRQLVSRPMVGLRIPNPPIGVRIVAGQPIHAVAEWLGARLQPSLISVPPRRGAPTDARSAPEGRAKRVHSERHVQCSPVAQPGVERPSYMRLVAGSNPAWGTTPS